MCHNPAILFDVKDRGYLKPGYFADIVLVNPNQPITVQKDQLLYKCGWSPFEGVSFQSQVTHTLLNGQLVFVDGEVSENKAAKRLTFNR